MTTQKPFSPEEFKEIYSKATRLCIEVVIKTPEGVVLSLRNLPSWKGLWHLPGSTVFYKEKVIDTVKRVALEELGVSVSVGKLLGYIEYISEEKERGFGYTVSMAFLCFLDKTDTKDMLFFKLNNEASNVKIFKELPDNMINEQRVFLESVWQEIK